MKLTTSVVETILANKFDEREIFGYLPVEARKRIKSKPTYKRCKKMLNIPGSSDFHNKYLGILNRLFITELNKYPHEITDDLATTDNLIEHFSADDIFEMRSWLADDYYSSVMDDNGDIDRAERLSDRVMYFHTNAWVMKEMKERGFFTYKQIKQFLEVR